MRFEVSYSSGTTHEVNLAGSVVVLGRDPDCDIVLNDTKCSRRHAVVEDTPEGHVIRDSGSANGVYVNGRRVDRAFVKPGDSIRLGDVRLTVLAEIGETVILAPDDVPVPPAAPPQASLTRPAFPAPRPQAAAPALAAVEPEPPRRDPPAAVQSRARRRQPSERPLTVTILSALWVLSGPAASAAIAIAVARLDAGPGGWVVAALVSLLLVPAGLAMALGLRALAPWARHLQIASAYFGLLACPFTPAAATTLLYFSRSDVRRAFEPGDGRTGAGPAETAFAVSIVAMVLVGVVVAAFTAFLLWPLR